MPYKCQHCGEEEDFYRDDIDEVRFSVYREVENHVSLNGDGGIEDSEYGEELDNIGEDWDETIGTNIEGDVHCQNCDAIVEWIEEEKEKDIIIRGEKYV